MTETLPDLEPDLRREPELPFGARLRQCRQAAGLSLRQLAARVGFDHSYLSQVERGQRPGSPDLARLCDTELGTDPQLTETYRRTAAKPAARPRTDTFVVAADPLDAAWHRLTAVLPAAPPLPDDPHHLDDLQRLPAARRLPELISELSMLQSGQDAKRQAERVEVSLRIAATLTACGRPGEAKRWWWAARQLAEALGEPGLRSLVRSREAMSGLAEGRPLPLLLRLTDEAVALAQQSSRRPDHLFRARSARARILAELGREVEARELLPQVLSHVAELPSASTSHGCTPYEVHALEGSVCASLGYWTAGCLMFGRALELCPVERLEERALLELSLAECFAGSGQGADALAIALRILIELPDEWHTTYLYAAAERVLTSVRARQPGLPAAYDLETLLARRPWGSRSVGSESS